MFPEGLAVPDVDSVSSVLAQPVVQATGEVAGTLTRSQRA